MNGIYEVTDEAGNLNTIIASEEFVQAQFPNRYVRLGDVVEPVTPSTEQLLAPLSRRRLRLALLSINIEAADIEAVIADIPGEFDRKQALIEWEDATEYERDHPLLREVQTAFDLPDEQVDALWVWASTL